MKALVLLAMIGSLSGCAVMKTTETIFSEIVSDYCKAPETGRSILRGRVSSVLAPNSIQINCAVDQPQQ